MQDTAHAVGVIDVPERQQQQQQQEQQQRRQ
jgi:hypothetical protein